MGKFIALIFCFNLSLGAPLRPNTIRHQTKSTFERRILPIFRSTNPSSCSECHLSGVDLKQYIRPSERETFLALSRQGLINAADPDKSHLLELIRKSRPRTDLLTAGARKVEVEAFRNWIIEAVRNPEFLKLKDSPKDTVGPKVPLDIVRHTRIDQVVESFRRNIWTQQGRCMGCHTPGTSAFADNVRKFGEKVNWFVADDPEATMRRIIERKLIDTTRPEESVLLLKPLNKIQHGGGVKFLYGDAGYQQFRTWIDDYAASINGKYADKSQLPPPERVTWIYTDAILTINNAPDSWGDKLVRVDIHAREGNGWSRAPIASGDRQVDAKSHSTNIWLWLVPPTGSPREQALRANPAIPPGNYLLKFYVDRSGKPKTDYRHPTDDPAFLAVSQEVTSSWRKGWGDRTMVVMK